MKIKNIIKSAVKAKVTAAKAKAKAKVAAKLAAKAKCKGGKCSPCGDDCSDGSCSPCSGGKCKPCAIALALILAATMCGCMGTSTPSRSQTLTMRDCTVNIYGSGDLGTTNDVARVDIASQNMMIENSGTETQTATPTQTTDVKPDIDLNYNGPAKAAADSAGGVAESAVELIKSATAD